MNIQDKSYAYQNEFKVSNKQKRKRQGYVYVEGQY